MITEFLVKLVALIFNVSHLLLECVLWLYLLLSRHKWFYRLGHLLQNRNPSKSGKCAIKSTTSVFTTSNICGVLHFRTDSRIMSSWRNRYCKITKRGVVRVLDSLPFHENHKIKVHRAVWCVVSACCDTPSTNPPRIVNVIASFHSDWNFYDDFRHTLPPWNVITLK